MGDADQLEQRIREEWDAAAGGWREWEAHREAFLWPTTHRMLEAAGIAPPQHVLDVGCGIGDPALAIAMRVGPAGRVIATDPAPDMIDCARQRAAALGLTNIEFHVAAAEDIAPTARPFDAVTGRFSFIFCTDPVATLRRVRSMMRSGGHIAVATWTPLEENPGAAAINSALRRHADIPPVDPRRPGQFQLSAPGDLAHALTQAGFSHVAVEPVRLYQFARDGAEFWTMMSEMGAALRQALQRLPAHTQQLVADDVIAFAERHREGGVVRIPALAQVGRGSA